MWPTHCYRVIQGWLVGLEGYLHQGCTHISCARLSYTTTSSTSSTSGTIQPVSHTVQQTLQVAATCQVCQVSRSCLYKFQSSCCSDSQQHINIPLVGHLMVCHATCTQNRSRTCSSGSDSIQAEAWRLGFIYLLLKCGSCSLFMMRSMMTSCSIY